MRKAKFTLTAVLSAIFSSCAVGFDPQNMVTGVRILATTIDKPYAAPLDTVKLEVLAVDGRKNPSTPLRHVWIPVTCTNPENDAYYNCFKDLLERTQGGSGGASGIPPITTNTNLNALLPSGTTFNVSIPKNALESHAAPKSGDPYGLVIVFQFACAGDIKLLPTESLANNLQTSPLGCFDVSGQHVSPDEYVFAFTRVYVYASKRNQNPAVLALQVNGADVDRAKGFTLDRCVESVPDKCAPTTIDVKVPDDAQEMKEGDMDPDGRVRREQVWVTYYTTGGRFDADAKLLFDVETGRVRSGTENSLRAPKDPGNYTLWAVVHDNRNGISWLEVPFVVR